MPRNEALVKRRAEASSSEDVIPEGLEVLRSSWQFAAVLQFCRLFSAPLRLTPFSADVLERALRSPFEFSVFLGELFTRLLKAETPATLTEVETAHWTELLSRRVACNWPVSFESNPLGDTNFGGLSLPLKVRCMHASGW